MPRKSTILHVKRTRAKGKEYFYFRTGRLNPQGKEIVTPLPALTDPGFGGAYASCMAARTRRQNVAAAITVTELCDLWEKSDKWTKPRARGGYSDGTKKLYRISLDYFRSQLPTAPAGELAQKDIARLIDQRAEHPGAANSILRTINSLYKWARRRGHVTNDPGRDVEELEVGEHEPWPAHVLDAALAAKDDRVRLGAHLLYYTAQRIGDVVMMKGADIRGGALHVVQQKTGRSLDIRIHADLQAELNRHSFGLDYIVPGAKPGQPLHQQTLREALKDFAETLGADVVPHGLRKNAVNALLEAGCTVAETASISGQSLQMVEHYAKQRAQGSLASAAILKWENKPRPGKHQKTGAENG